VGGVAMPVMDSIEAKMVARTMLTRTLEQHQKPCKGWQPQDPNGLFYNTNLQAHTKELPFDVPCNAGKSMAAHNFYISSTSVPCQTSVSSPTDGAIAADTSLSDNTIHTYDQQEMSFTKDGSIQSKFKRFFRWTRDTGKQSEAIPSVNSHGRGLKLDSQVNYGIYQRPVRQVFTFSPKQTTI
jgi:hypothetical protein